MSEVRLVVREAAKDWSGTIHGSCADRAIAALSADPETLEELEAATARFAKPDPRFRFFTNLAPSLDDQPYDAGLVVIDLAARLVVVNSTYSSPCRQGTVCYHDGQSCTQVSLRYHLAEDWRFTRDSQHWQSLADERRRARAATPPLDEREIFYGRVMLEFLARETFMAFAQRDDIVAALRIQWIENARNRIAKEKKLSPDQVDVSCLNEDDITPKTWPGQERFASPFYNTLKEIHAAWMLTPREELRGVCPREIALLRHNHLMADARDRCDQWSRMDQCPPGLDESSHAYRYGGFGTHELVQYYELVRELLWSCWERLSELSQSQHELEFLAVGDFLASEVPRLERVRDEWLDTPDPEFHLRTPRSIIHRERARLPEGLSGRDAMIDPDCPCCQMMADMSGPMFWHFDCSGMDDEFAFDIACRTRQEWEEEHRGWEEHNRRFSAEWSERERLGVADQGCHESDADNIWSRSFLAEETTDLPLGVRVFGIGCRLAELIVDLRDGSDRGHALPKAQALIDQLNRDFGNLREITEKPVHSLAETLIAPLLDRFAETLSNVAASRPDLAEKCDSLTGELRKFLDPPPPQPTGDVHDFDVPY